MKIVEQHLLPEGVMTKYENGEEQLLPYLIDENGQEYVELFPNDYTGVQPSGKAPDSGSGYPRFKSSHPSHKNGEYYEQF